MTPESPSVRIEPVCEADFPALAEICGAAMETDKHTLLKAAHPTNPYDHAGGMIGAFEYWNSLPKNRVEFVKAVDEETGQVLGLICWGSRLEKAQPNPEQQAKDGRPESKADKPSVTVSESYTKTADPSLDPLAQLNEFTSSHLAEYQEKVMPPGVCCMYVMTIAVHPKHQGRGVGTALLKHGTDRADSENVFCWVHASEAGAVTFRKCDFKVDETLEIDLDEPARKMGIKPPVGQDKWGTYTFTYMIRRPKGGFKNVA